MSKRDEQHSIDAEPHWRSGHGNGDSAYDEPALTGQPVDASAAADGAGANDEERAYHNVWDEPASLAAGLKAPEHATTYARWYTSGLERVSSTHAWGVTAILALVGGPLALLGAMFPAQPRGLWSMLAVVSVGPVMEEVLKISAVVIALERRPFLFRSHAQIFIAVIASAALFSLVENLMYLYFWIPDPSPALITWRWSVCTALHIGTTTVAGLGIVQMWRVSRHRMARPQMHDAFPYVVTAIVIHCAYNALAVAYTAFFDPF